MITIPAIDVYQGKCVRLRQGQFNDLSVYEMSPKSLASSYAQQGAKFLHIVDLEGAKNGTPLQLDLVSDMVNCGIPVQAGGGIRSVAHAEAYLERGVAKIVMGSVAISNPPLMQDIIDAVQADNIVLALDIHMDNGTPKPAINGWQTSTHTSLWTVASHYQRLGITHILCTDIGLDGMMQGPNLALYKQALHRFPTLSWQASGGIRHQEDLQTLADLGLSGAILGRTLYESELDLAACFENH